MNEKTARALTAAPIFAAVIVALFIYPVSAAPMEMMVWAFAGMLHLPLLIERTAEALVLAVALIPTAWLAMRAYRAETRMAAGLEP